LRKLAVELVDVARDGNTTEGVLGDLARAPAAAHFVTLTAGGNDLLGGADPFLTGSRQLAHDQIVGVLDHVADGVVGVASRR
jgi:hypothetical protein